MQSARYADLRSTTVDLVHAFLDGKERSLKERHAQMAAAVSNLPFNITARARLQASGYAEGIDDVLTTGEGFSIELPNVDASGIDEREVGTGPFPMATELLSLSLTHTRAVALSLDRSAGRRARSIHGSDALTRRGGGDRQKHAGSDEALVRAA